MHNSSAPLSEHISSERQVKLDPNSCKSFKKVLFMGQPYEVGSNVYVRTQRHQGECVGKILRIFNYEQSNSTFVPLVEVQWYCTKHDIAENYKDFFEYFSEYELFVTELTNIVFIDCLLREFTVLPLEEFDKLYEVPQDTYFCRASYDMRKAKMSPEISEWKKTCTCQRPPNPDLLYIQCDGCSMWYHLQCIGLTQQQADVIENYTCKKCA